MKYISISYEMICQQKTDVKCKVYCFLWCQIGVVEVIMLENDALNQLPQPTRCLVTDYCFLLI